MHCRVCDGDIRVSNILIGLYPVGVLRRGFPEVLAELPRVLAGMHAELVWVLWGILWGCFGGYFGGCFGVCFGGACKPCNDGPKDPTSSIDGFCRNALFDSHKLE